MAVGLRGRGHTLPWPALPFCIVGPNAGNRESTLGAGAILDAILQHVRHVRVDVDQAGDRGVPREIDWRAGAGTDALDEPDLDGDAGVLPDFRAVPNSTKMIRRGPGGHGEEENQLLAHNLLRTSGDRFRPQRMTAAFRSR